LANFARKRVAAGASRRGHLRSAREGASAAHHRLIIMRGIVGELDRMHGGAAAPYALSGRRCRCHTAVRARATDAAIRSSTELAARARCEQSSPSWGHAHRGQPSQQSDKMERRFLPGVKVGAPNTV